MRTFSWLAAIAAVVVVATPARADELTGVWLTKNAAGEDVRFALKDDGTYDLAGQTGRWKRSGDTLTLTPDRADEAGPGTYVYKFTIDGDKLTVAGADLPQPATFTRESTRATPAPKREPMNPDEPKPEEKKSDEKSDKPELSRPPQIVPKSATKLTPKFKSKTRVEKDPQGKYAFEIPEGWTLIPAQKDNVRYFTVNPGYQPTDVWKHQIVFTVVPTPPSELAKGFKERVDQGEKEVDKLFPGFHRTKDVPDILDAPGGLIARLDYEGALTNANVQGQPAVATIAVTQRKVYAIFLTVLSLKDVAGEHLDDAFAMLDSIDVKMKDREVELEKRIVGQWVVPSKTGNRFETYDFFADGTYKWHFESSYTGSIKDSGGNTTASWGTASQDDEHGRYEIRGDIIFFVSKRGEQGSVFEIFQDGDKVKLRIGNATLVR